jgi:MraZ protein
MSLSEEFLQGEFRRTLDERYRLSIPAELANPLSSQGSDCILTKEQEGSLSLWSAASWQEKLDSGVELVQAKMKAGRLDGRVSEVQMLGRLLSTRHRPTQLTGRGRLLIPEGFREFLGVEPGGEVLVVGAAVCVELWRPAAWVEYLQEKIPEFRRLFDELAG